EAAHGVKFVRHWVHAAPVRLDGKKMSKSLGNMVFVRDVLEDTTPQALRIYLLDRHYRRAFDHDEARLARARRRAIRLAATLGVGPVGPPERGAATRGVVDAFRHDLEPASATPGVGGAAAGQAGR